MKAFLKENKFTIASDVITEYKTHLQNYLQEINIAIQKNESEEHKEFFNEQAKQESLPYQKRHNNRMKTKM